MSDSDRDDMLLGDGVMCGDLDSESDDEDPAACQQREDLVGWQHEFHSHASAESVVHAWLEELTPERDHAAGGSCSCASARSPLPVPPPLHCKMPESRAAPCARTYALAERSRASPGTRPFLPSATRAGAPTTRTFSRAPRRRRSQTTSGSYATRVRWRCSTSC